ncbi:hypothetical protein SDC9_209885 [bioreactor metagenome]|uniref:Uncharacterized protein n=1 Tax=bioreactor metagenome TaxID=1076179 RepID=A0A645JEI9_9ZZZZ
MRRCAEIPVGKTEIRCVAQEIPVDGTARIDEMDFQIGRAGDLVQIENRLGKAAESVQRAALQEFGQGSFKRNTEARMRAETGVAALIGGIEQGDTENRVASSQ